MADTGVDRQHCLFIDKNLGQVKSTNVEDSYYDHRYRKVIQYVDYSGSQADVADGHGTHVAGTLVGDCTIDDRNYANVHPFRGMAPGAKLAVFDIGTATPD